MATATREEDIDWPRMNSFLRQEARRKDWDADQVQALSELLKRITEQCASSSRTRPIVQRVARVLLDTNLQPVILVPCCPDYSHSGGKYTFHSLGKGVSLLAQRQIAFLQQVVSLLPEATVHFLIADQEAEDEALCEACRVSHSEFHSSVMSSLDALRTEIDPYGWKADLFTEIVPDLLTREQELVRDMLSEEGPHFRQIQTEMMFRRPMYECIIPTIKTDAAMERTARTAAQYLILGNFAGQKRMLISNHTTTNLSWYGRTEAGVLHNPVEVY